MSSRGQFFIIFFITCIVISILFYFVFRHKNTPLLPYYFSKTPTGLPGMDRKRTRLPSKKDDELGKPLPPPKMPVAPVPLVVKVAPPGPPLEKPMMT
jgi:hypothetical protein